MNPTLQGLLMCRGLLCKDNKRIFGSWNDVDGAEALLWRDGEKIRKYIEEKDIFGAYEVEKAESSLLACKSCKRRIGKGQV